jgi:hypothetical protein
MILVLASVGSAGPVNVAASANGGVASQSSTYEWDCYNYNGWYCGHGSLPAYFANDGVTWTTNPNFPGGGSASGTTSELNAWWNVVFDNAYPVNSITIYNCAYSCLGDINTFSVFLADGNGTTVWSSTANTIDPSNNVMTFSPGGTVANSLKIELDGTNYLSLLEVQAFSDPTAGSPEPSTWMLLAAGVGLISFRRSRAK